MYKENCIEVLSQHIYACIET